MGRSSKGTLAVFLVRLCPCELMSSVGGMNRRGAEQVLLRILRSCSQIAAMESFLRHINKQVRQGEEQESLVAAAQAHQALRGAGALQREVEKVRETEEAGFLKVRPGREGEGQRCQGLCV